MKRESLQILTAKPQMSGFVQTDSSRTSSKSGDEDALFYPFQNVNFGKIKADIAGKCCFWFEDDGKL